MIFEDITDTDHKLRRTKRNKTQLISKYVELKRLESIYQTSTHLQKKKLRHPEVKRYVLKLIHDELRQRLKPEETFELWHRAVSQEGKRSKPNGKRKIKSKPDYDDTQFNNDRLSTNIYRFLDELVPDDINEDDVELKLQVDDNLDDEEYDEYNIISSAKLDQITKNFDVQNTSIKAQFIIESSGMEILPNQSTSSTHSVLNRHLNNMNTLLHINILRQNWELSYKLFCIIIRFPMVDIRQLWPLGIEILTQLGTKNKEQPATMRVTKFFNYLNSFYTVSYRNTISIERSDRSAIAPAWRSGTRSLTPMYLITSLWHLFVQQEYEQILNKILELILEPPYHKEGVLYFIAALCYLCQCCTVVNHFALQHDLDKFSETGATYRSTKECLNLLSTNWKKIELNLNKCKEFEFDLPFTELRTQWEMIVEKLYEIEKSNNDEKVKANGTTIIDTIPDVEETNVWNEIVLDDDEAMAPIETSTQNKNNKNMDYNFGVPEAVEDIADPDADDDWSQIRSDSEEDGDVMENRLNKSFGMEAETQVDGNNEWEAITSDSEEEKDTLQKLQNFQEKGIHHESPTQHDSAFLNIDDTILIDEGNQNEMNDTNDANLEEDEDNWEQIESDHEDIDAPMSDGGAEKDLAASWVDDAKHKGIGLVKQMYRSLADSQVDDNDVHLELRWTHNDDAELGLELSGESINQKLVDKTLEDVETSSSKHGVNTLSDKFDSNVTDYDLEWSQIEDGDVSMRSSLDAPVINQIEKPNNIMNGNQSMATSKKEVPVENDWDEEWSQIDDDVMPLDDNEHFKKAEPYVIELESNFERTEAHDTRQAHPFDLQHIIDSNTTGNTLGAGNYSASVVSEVDESIEDSLASSFNDRRNSLELHQKRLKEDAKWKVRRKSTSKWHDKTKSPSSDHKVKKHSSHKKEKKHKYKHKHKKLKKDSQVTSTSNAL